MNTPVAFGQQAHFEQPSFLQSIQSGAATLKNTISSWYNHIMFARKAKQLLGEGPLTTERITNLEEFRDFSLQTMTQLDVWRARFAHLTNMPSPRLIVSRSATSICGPATKTHPCFYCGGDNSIIIHPDYFLSFIGQEVGILQNTLSFRAILAHEYMHAIQYFIRENLGIGAVFSRDQKEEYVILEHWADFGAAAFCVDTPRRDIPQILGAVGRQLEHDFAQTPAGHKNDTVRAQMIALGTQTLGQGPFDIVRHQFFAQKMQASAKRFFEQIAG